MKRVYREIYSGVNMDKVLITENCTQNYWESLTNKAMRKAPLDKRGNPKFYPESPFSFSFVKREGIIVRFYRC